MNAIDAAPPPPDAWMSNRAASRVIGTCPQVIRKLAAKGLIRSRHIPGVRTRYLRADVERLAREGVAVEA